MIGDVPSLEVVDYSSDDGNCSAWSVVTGSVNGSDVTAATTQQQVAVSTEVRIKGKTAVVRVHPTGYLLSLFGMITRANTIAGKPSAWDGWVFSPGTTNINREAVISFCAEPRRLKQ